MPGPEELANQPEQAQEQAQEAVDTTPVVETAEESVEKTEHFAELEEVKAALGVILKGKECTESLIKNDEQGLSVYEVQVNGENGEITEYNYQKAKYNYRDESLPVTARFSGSIHKIDYDSSGMPVSGECVANCLDGQWEFLV